MKKIFAAILLFIWIFLGIALPYYFYHNFKNVKDETIKKQVERIRTFSKNTNEMIDKLPSIFRESHTTAVILILNQKSKLLGSLYEPSRVNRYDYGTILKTYKSTELKEYAYLHLPFTSGYSIWVISKKNISLQQFFQSMLENDSKLILIPIVYAFMLLIILMVLLFDPGKKIEKDIVNEVSRKHETKGTGNYKISNDNTFLSNKILLLLDTIEKNFSTSTIAFYSRESGIWKHVMEKTGNLSIKGDAAIENLPNEILNLSDNTWREPLLSHDKNLLFIPLHYRNLLFGLIKLQFTGLASEIDQHSLDTLISLCTRYSDSLFMQRVYDKAVTDSETDFYNYPYFYFIVKEKLGSSQNFAVVVFEITDLNRVSPETTRSWSQDIIVELDKIQLKPLVSARLDRAKFAFLYEVKSVINKDSFNDTREKVDLINLEKVPGIIQNLTHKYFKHTTKLNGGFVIRPTNFEDADTFMQRLDYLLINSAFSAYSSDFNNKFSFDPKKP